MRCSTAICTNEARYATNDCHLYCAICAMEVEKAPSIIAVKITDIPDLARMREITETHVILATEKARDAFLMEVARHFARQQIIE